MTAAGAALGGFDVVHGHDWLVARAAHALARRLRRRTSRRSTRPSAAATRAGSAGTPVARTEHGRHQGRVGRHPRRTSTPRSARMARRARRALVCRHHMRGDVADVFGLAEERVTVVPNGVDRSACGVPGISPRSAPATPRPASASSC
jgi:glycogen(starch) synthase